MGIQTEAGGEIGTCGEHLVARTAVNHAEEVVGPIGHHAPAAIAQCHRRLACKAPAELGHLFVRHVPHAHGVGLQPQLVMAHDHAEAPDQAFFDPARNQLDRHRLAEPDAGAQAGERLGLDLQPLLQGGDERALDRRQRTRRVTRAEGDRLATLRACRARPCQVEAKVDVELFFQRQHDDLAAGIALDGCDHLAQLRLRSRRHHEPQVVVVLALVVVVDRGFPAHPRRHRLEALGWRGQRGQRTGPQASRREHRPHPAYQALLAELAVGRDDRLFAAADAVGDAGEGPRFEREVALPLVEQAKGRVVDRARQTERAWHQNPVRAARVVKKMPLGLSESKPPICCLEAVS